MLSTCASCIGIYVNIRLTAGYDSPGRGYARPPSLHLRWKEGFCVLFIDNKIVTNINFRAPLSGEAEERVTGAASPGESSPPSDMHRCHFISRINNINKLNLRQSLM